MIMWGKLRVYGRQQFDEGKTKAPPRRKSKLINPVQELPSCVIVVSTLINTITKAGSSSSSLIYHENITSTYIFVIPAVNAYDPQCLDDNMSKN